MAEHELVFQTFEMLLYLALAEDQRQEKAGLTGGMGLSVRKCT